MPTTGLVTMTKGANNAARSAFRPDYFGAKPAALAGEWQFGRDFTTSKRSLLAAGPELAAIGAPTYTERKAAIPSAAGFDTGISEALNQTLIWAGNIGGTPAPFFSTFTGALNRAIWFGVFGGNLYFFAGVAPNTLQFSGTSTSYPGNVAYGTDCVCAIRFVDAGATFTTKMDIFKNGARLAGNSTVSSGARELGTGTIKIGVGATTYVGPSNTYGGEIINAALSDAALLAEVQAINTNSRARTGAHKVDL